MYFVESKEVIGIIQLNSIEYLEEVFRALIQNKEFIPLKNEKFFEQVRYFDFNKIVTPEQKTGWYAPNYKLGNGDNVAQISFTSGTEGEPKGIILTHQNLHNTVVRLIDIMQITSDIKEYVGVPVYHSFGYGRVRVCNHVGGRVFIPESGFNPQEISKLLSNGEINAISAVPTLWRILLQQQHLFLKIGQNIRWIEIGSQFMSEDEKRELCRIFPNARIVQHYGLTEASRSTFLVISEGENLKTVGEPTGDSELRINESGRIEVRGSHVAKYQVNSTGLEKITNDDGWFITNDLGQLNQGFLSFLGRADDIINIGGLKVSPEKIERKLFKLLDISFGLAITKIDDIIRGETLLLNILTEHSSKLIKIQECIHILLTDMNIKLGGQVSVQVLSKFPVTDTGKIQRKVLSERYHQQVNETKDIDALASLTEKLMHNLELPFISDLDSFLSINGDSLLLMIMSIEIEKHIGYLPENWEAMSFGHLNVFAKIDDEPFEKKIYPYGWVLVILICTLIIGELFLQTRSHVNTGRSAFNLINDESTVVFNKELGVKTYRPNIQIRDYKTGRIKYDINQLGLRSPAIEKQPTKEELRIAVVGASTVAGAYADTNYSTFPALLEQRLRNKNSNLVNVINGGVDGLTLSGITSITEKIILPLKPQYVAIYTGFNDITSICHKKNSNSVSKLQPLLNPPQMPNWLMTADMIKKNTVSLREAPKNKNTYIDVDTVDATWYRNAVESIVTKIISHGVTPVLMTNARSYVNVERAKARELATTSLYYYYCLDLNGIIKVGEKFNNSIRDVARMHNLPLIDIAKTMPGGREYFVDGGHFTLKGEEFVAQQLSEFFQSNK